MYNLDYHWIDGRYTNKGLLLGMFACAALVACSDNDIVENTDVNNSKGEKAEAYLTFAVASSGNSSRAVTNDGDNHGDADDSGHYNTGTAQENNIKQIMFVFYNSSMLEGDGVAAVYNIGTDGTSADIDKNSDGTYSPKTPYQLSTTGTYKALVIINPNATLAAKIGSGATNVKNIYDEILAGSNSAITDIIGTDNDAFMMINKAEATITVTSENNNPNTPATGIIEVERVASKIAFRPTTLSSFTATGSLTDGANVYKIEAQHTTYTVETSDGWIPNGSSFTYYDKFNKATTDQANPNERTTIYVLIADGTTKFYTKGDNHTGNLSGGEITAPIMTPYNYTGKPIYQGTAGNTTTVPYYVRLEQYALVNLNNAVYNVRHTSSNATAANSKPFGTVSSSNYLYEPNTGAKTAMDLTNGWTTESSGNAWFGTTALYNVENAISTNTGIKTYFKALPKTNNDNNEYDNSEGGVTGSTTPEASNVGSCLAYCMENAVVSTNQDPRLTTGIFFQAQIYDAKGNVVTCMYKYNNSFYKDLKALNAATENQFENCLDENNQNGELDATLSGAGVEVYRDGKCYYFSSEIKHFDNGVAADKGVMEYAIMRNNIYSLEVSSVDGFGFSSTEIVPGETTGDGEGDLSVYLTLRAEILPWIVRFNNIEF